MSNSQSLESQTQKCFIRVSREEFCSSNTHSKSRKQKKQENLYLTLTEEELLEDILTSVLWNSIVNT